MQYKITYLSVLVFLIISIVTLQANAEKQSGEFFINLDLDFFNKFNSHGASPPTDTFQRYHMLTIGYQQYGWNVGFSYNWLDYVTGPVSTHVITPWKLSLLKTLDSSQELELDYIWVKNLVEDRYSSNGLRIQYNRQDNIKNNFIVHTQIGTKLINNNKLLPIIGTQITYRDFLRLGINQLELFDEHLLDDQDYILNFPVNLGATCHFNDNVKIEFDYYHYLFGTDSQQKMNSWFRTVFKIKIL